MRFLLYPDTPNHGWCYNQVLNGSVKAFPIKQLCHYIVKYISSSYCLILLPFLSFEGLYYSIAANLTTQKYDLLLTYPLSLQTDAFV